MSKKGPDKDSAKRKNSELSSSDSELSGSTGAPDKKAFVASITPKETTLASASVNMSWSKANPVAPATFTPPNPDAIREAINEISGAEASGSNVDGANSVPSYVSKAKKARVDYPFALYILAGSEERKNLTLHHYVGFEEFLFNSILKAEKEESSKIKIDFSIFRSTHGIVACTNEYTSYWVKNLTKAYKYEEESTRAYNRWESEEATIYSVFLSGEMFRQPRCKPNWITAKILDINQLKGDFSSAVLEKKSNRDGAYLSFEAISK